MTCRRKQRTERVKRITIDSDRGQHLSPSLRSRSELSLCCHPALISHVNATFSSRESRPSSFAGFFRVIERATRRSHSSGINTTTTTTTTTATVAATEWRHLIGHVTTWQLNVSFGRPITCSTYVSLYAFGRRSKTRRGTAEGGRGKKERSEDTREDVSFVLALHLWASYTRMSCRSIDTRVCVRCRLPASARWPRTMARAQPSSPLPDYL